MAIPFTPLTFSNNMPSGYALDDNFTAIQTALQAALSRSSSTNNEMQVDLDLNSNALLNIGSFIFTSISSDSASNNSLFLDSSDGKLKFKNSSGTINSLY